MRTTLLGIPVRDRFTCLSTGKIPVRYPSMQRRALGFACCTAAPLGRGAADLTNVEKQDVDCDPPSTCVAAVRSSSNNACLYTHKWKITVGLSEEFKENSPCLGKVRC